MANQKQLEILKKGVGAWNEWREKNPDVEIDLKEADLSTTNLVHANLKMSDLSGADLRGANLMEAVLWRANLTKVDFTGAILIGADLYSTNLSKSNLTEANLSGTHLIHAKLQDVNVSHINLTNADLRFTNLNKVNFNGSNLGSVNFNYAYLRNANLEKTNLKYARLLWANLTDTMLSEADLTNAHFGETILTQVDLSKVIGLSSITHKSSSILSLYTIRISKGNLSLEFLRGCGLSDLEIEAAKLTKPGLDVEQVTDITYGIHQLYLGDGIQYYSCFISYNSKDENFAKQLHDDLQNRGVRCWFAPEDMKIGDQIRPKIDQQIRLRDKLLVILSENSVNSEWVGDEVEAALEEESKSNRLVLFPIRLDDTVMSTRDDWAAKIKHRRHIGDFSNWKDKASYQKAFEHLLKDLKATGSDINGE